MFTLKIKIFNKALIDLVRKLFCKQLNELTLFPHDVIFYSDLLLKYRIKIRRNIYGNPFTY